MSKEKETVSSTDEKQQVSVSSFIFLNEQMKLLSRRQEQVEANLIEINNFLNSIQKIEPVSSVQEGQPPGTTGTETTIDSPLRNIPNNSSVPSYPIPEKKKGFRLF